MSTIEWIATTLLVLFVGLVLGKRLGRKERSGDFTQPYAAPSRAIPEPAPRALGGEAAIVVREHLRAGRMIQAIKSYRDATGANLKEAKEAVEAIAAREGIRP